MTLFMIRSPAAISGIANMGVSEERSSEPKAMRRLAFEISCRSIFSRTSRRVAMIRPFLTIPYSVSWTGNREKSLWMISPPAFYSPIFTPF